MPVWLVGSCHVLSCESSAHDGVIVVLHSSAAQSDVIETGGISCLKPDRRDSAHTDWTLRLNYGCIIDLLVAWAWLRDAEGSTISGRRVRGICSIYKTLYPAPLYPLNGGYLIKIKDIQLERISSSKGPEYRDVKIKLQFDAIHVASPNSILQIRQISCLKIKAVDLLGCSRNSRNLPTLLFIYMFFMGKCVVFF